MRVKPLSALTPDPCFGSEMNSGDPLGHSVQASCQQKATTVTHPGTPTCQSVETEPPGSVNNYQDAVSGTSKDETVKEKEIVKIITEVGRKENSTADKKLEDCSKFLRLQKIRNMKEKKRREKINEKIQALQKLLPHSDKGDKASILADAVDYIKFLQIKLQAFGLCSKMHMHPPSAATTTPATVPVLLGADGAARESLPLEQV